jgi:hypothetical protein
MKVRLKLGDHIGRIFAYVLGAFSPMYWAHFRLCIGRIFAYVLGAFLHFITSGSSFENYRCGPNFGASFFFNESLVLLLAKAGWATSQMHHRLSINCD